MPAEIVELGITGTAKVLIFWHAVGAVVGFIAIAAVSAYQRDPFDEEWLGWSLMLSLCGGIGSVLLVGAFGFLEWIRKRRESG